MNYIKALEARVAKRDNVIAAYETGLIQLLRYMYSPKFQTDTTVQVGDVVDRIGDIKHDVNDVWFTEGGGD